jgi:hypothetical protein
MEKTTDMRSQTHSASARIWVDALACVMLFCVALLPVRSLAEGPDAEAASDAESARLRASIELLRSDIRTEKTEIISENIEFTAEQAAKFWPLHAEYNVALNRLFDERLYLINDYLGLYESMTDKQAEALAKRSFDWEARNTKLKRTWFKKFSKVITARKAAQFFQIEGRLNSAIDLQISAGLPLIR